jgi:chromosome segregation ATPase
MGNQDDEQFLRDYEQRLEWRRKGATLSDKTARKEFGLTQDEIYDAIDAGTLHYRQAAMHGNPWLRLLRREVEALARTSRGDRYVNEQQARAELARVHREIKRLQTELAELEERRSKLRSDLGE